MYKQLKELDGKTTEQEFVPLIKWPGEEGLDR